MKKTPQKHMTYFNVLETFEHAGCCALCALELHSMRRYLDNLLYENVNDTGVRGNLAGSRGYCPRHAHMLLKFADGLGTAILYRDQVLVTLEFLQGQTNGFTKLDRANKLREFTTPRDRCSACVMQARDRQRYISTFLEWFDEPEMRQAFDAGPGLCVPHLLLVLEQVRNTASREYLIAAHIDKYAGLANQLDEFIGKHDYRFCDEPLGDEKDSWQRVVNMMVGVKDVF